MLRPCDVLEKFGYVTLRFDMRGCGESEGEHGRVICLEQVEDTSNALTFLAKHPAVDPDRIGLIGSSFGGAVAVYTAGVDRARCRRHLQRRLGRRRAQVPRPASGRRRRGRASPRCWRTAAATASRPASR